MNIFFKTINNTIFLLFTLFVITVNNAQKIRVIDNKGTIGTVRNNQVTTAISVPINPLQNDVWFDTNDTNTIVKIYDSVNSSWKIINSDNVTTNATAPTVNNIGDIWFDTNSTPNTLNVWNGTAWSNGAWPSNKVTNELCFQDDDYYYVSLLINTTDWEVTRYTKADINIEEKATGTGTQPNNIVNVTGLTYN
jgi:hypothetical protein